MKSDARTLKLFGAKSWIVGTSVVFFSACTPLAVATHTTDADPNHIPAGHYQLDPDHWSVLFDVNHLHYSRFVMRFDHVKASLDYGTQGFQGSSVTAVIDAKSVDTNVAALNRMVSGPDMLNVTQYPEIRFESTSLRATGPTTAEMRGNLTICGVTQPVTLAVSLEGAAPNPLTKAETMGFSATGTFDRASFGRAKWFPAVGNDVHVVIQAEFVAKPAAAT